MSYWVAGATVVSAGLSYKSSSDATDAYEDAQDESILFERERYEDWKSTYGGVEENLSDYFSNLTPEYYEAQGLEAFQTEQQAALDNVRANLAQRGIADSGIAAQAEIDFAVSGAEKRADIRAQAPSLAREEQFRFLQAGLGLSPGSSYSQALSEQARGLGDTASAAQSAAGEATSTAVSSVGTALADYFDKPVQAEPAPAQSSGGGESGGGGLLSSIGGLFSDVRLKQNIRRVGTLDNGLGWYMWDWTDEATKVVQGQTSEGVLAQEVQERFPDAVGKRDGYITIDYARIH